MGLIDRRTTSKVPEELSLPIMAVHGLPCRIDINRAGLADGLSPNPETDEGHLHRILCALVRGMPVARQGPRKGDGGGF
jgi:hypothetical protein